MCARMRRTISASSATDAFVAVAMVESITYSSSRVNDPVRYDENDDENYWERIRCSRWDARWRYGHHEIRRSARAANVTPMPQASLLSMLRQRASLQPNDTAFTFTDYERDWQ